MHSTGRSRVRSDDLTQVFLNEPGAEVYIHLNEGSVSGVLEAVDLARLDDENVARARFELFSIDVPETATFPYELNFIVWMPMRSGTTTGESAEQKH